MGAMACMRAWIGCLAPSPRRSELVQHIAASCRKVNAFLQFWPCVCPDLHAVHVHSICSANFEKTGLSSPLGTVPMRSIVQVFARMSALVYVVLPPAASEAGGTNLLAPQLWLVS